MRISKARIVALFGPSASGKSTIGKLLATDLSVPLRMCGEAVKLEARSKGVGFSDLTDDDHRAVDEQTRLWLIQTKGSCVVEGRFLNFVLSAYSASQPIMLIRLETASEVRRLRFASRSGTEFSPEAISISDRDDAIFRDRLYKGRQPLAPCLALDTSVYGPNECSSIIQARLSALRSRA